MFQYYLLTKGGNPDSDLCDDETIDAGDIHIYTLCSISDAVSLFNQY